MRTSFLIVILFSLFSEIKAQNRSILFEQNSLSTALAKASKENKLVFIDCYTEWCAPCKGMASNVFTQDKVADFFNAGFINVKLDMEKGEGPETKLKYKVGAYPTYLFLDGNGNLVYKFVGGMSADTFLIKSKEALNPQNVVAIMNRQYMDGDRSKPFLREYVKLKIEMQEIELGQKIAAEYFNLLTPTERTNPENWYLFGENRYSLYLSNIYSENFNYLAEHWKDFVGSNTKEAVESKLAKSYRQITEYCFKGYYFKKQPYNKTNFDRYRRQLEKTELADKRQLTTMINISQAVGEKDTATVVNLLADNIADFSEENKRILYGFVTMFDGRESALTRNVRCKEIFDKIIQTSSTQGLIATAKSYLKNFTN